MSLFNYPIYSGDTIFGKLKKTRGTCPAKTDICGNFPNNLFVIEGTIDIPRCSDPTFTFTNDKNDSPNGCCVVDTSFDSCDTEIEKKKAGGSIGTINSDGKYYDIGIDITDSSGTNMRRVCHSAPIRKRNLVISDFITIIIVSALILIITAIIGACYEFIFKYGECKDCIYYRSTCANRKRLSILDYMFPIELCNYPYQECNKNTSDTLVGGGLEKTGFISKYAEYTANGTKCITLHEVENKQTKPFPYNLIDYANRNIKSELVRMPYRAFAIFFLYTVLLSRTLISSILKRASIKYQQVVKHNPILSNIMFLFFTGILFNIIAKYTKIKELNGANGYILYFLIVLLSISFSVSCAATMIFLWWSPPTSFEKYYRQCDIPRSYYKMVDYKKLFYSFAEYKTKRPLYKKIIHIVFDIMLFVISFIMIMFSLCFGLFASTLAFLYMVITLLINMFYIPMSNTIEFLDIIKSHGYLLTILFCVTVLLASIDKMDSITSGILGGLMAVVILYTLIKNLR